jgi:flagella basal body P-ring formation protein FlgA
MMLAMLAILALAGDGAIAAAPLPKGTVLERAHFAESADDRSVEILLGKQLRRPVFAGRAVTVADVAAADVVTRQGPVTVTFTRGGLSLAMPGRALRSGSAGEIVPVLIEGRRRPVSVTVTGPNMAEIVR